MLVKGFHFNCEKEIMKFLKTAFSEMVQENKDPKLEDAMKKAISTMFYEVYGCNVMTKLPMGEIRLFTALSPDKGHLDYIVKQGIDMIKDYNQKYGFDIKPYTLNSESYFQVYINKNNPSMEKFLNAHDEEISFQVVRHNAQSEDNTDLSTININNVKWAIITNTPYLAFNIKYMDNDKGIYPTIDTYYCGENVFEVVIEFAHYDHLVRKRDLVEDEYEGFFRGNPFKVIDVASDKHKLIIDEATSGNFNAEEKDFIISNIEIE